MEPGVMELPVAMKASTVELIAELSDLIDGLWLTSDTELPFQTVAIEGVMDYPFLSVETLLTEIGFLEKHSIEQFLDYVLNANEYHFENLPVEAKKMFPLIQQKYKWFIRLCEKYLENLQVYRIIRKKIEEEDAPHQSKKDFTDAFYLIVGTTPDGEWLGWCPRFDVDDEVEPQPDCREIISNEVEFIKKPTLELMRQLMYETEDLIFPKESFGDDRVEWVDDFCMKATNQRQTIIDRLVWETRFVRMFEFKDFSAELLAMGYDNLISWDQEYADRLLELDTWMRSHLDHLRTYIIGCRYNFWLYTVGQTYEGDWVGVCGQGMWSG
jgi:hypothetical protein